MNISIPGKFQVYRKYLVFVWALKPNSVVVGDRFLRLLHPQSFTWAAQAVDGLGMGFRRRIPAGGMVDPCHL